MGIAWSDVAEMAPELNSLTAGAKQDIVDYVNELDLTQVNAPWNLPSESAQTARMAQIYLAAHLGTVTRRGASGAAGPVTGQSAGGLRRSYGLISAPGYLGTTSYGIAYLTILDQSLARGPFVI